MFDGLGRIVAGNNVLLKKEEVFFDGVVLRFVQLIIGKVNGAHIRLFVGEMAGSVVPKKFDGLFTKTFIPLVIVFHQDVFYAIHGLKQGAVLCVQMRYADVVFFFQKHGGPPRCSFK